MGALRVGGMADWGAFGLRLEPLMTGGNGDLEANMAMVVCVESIY